MEIKDSTGEIREKNATKVTVGCLLPQCTTSSLGMGCTGPLGPGLAPNELKYKKNEKNQFFWEKNKKNIHKTENIKKKRKIENFRGKLVFFFIFIIIISALVVYIQAVGFAGCWKKGAKKTSFCGEMFFFIVRNHCSGAGDLKFELYPEGLVKEKRWNALDGKKLIFDRFWGFFKSSRVQEKKGVAELSREWDMGAKRRIHPGTMCVRCYRTASWYSPCSLTTKRNAIAWKETFLFKKAYNALVWAQKKLFPVELGLFRCSSKEQQQRRRKRT